MRVFRHPLYLQAKYAQLLHYFRNGMWYHSKVLATDQHISGIFQSRQFLHGFMLPEFILPSIKIIDVKVVELVLCTFIQVLEGTGMIYQDPEMKLCPVGTCLLIQQNIGG